MADNPLYINATEAKRMADQVNGTAQQLLERALRAVADAARCGNYSATVKHRPDDRSGVRTVRKELRRRGFKTRAWGGIWIDVNWRRT